MHSASKHSKPLRGKGASECDQSAFIFGSFATRSTSVEIAQRKSSSLLRGCFFRTIKFVLMSVLAWKVSASICEHHRSNPGITRRTMRVEPKNCKRFFCGWFVDCAHDHRFGERFRSCNASAPNAHFWR